MKYPLIIAYLQEDELPKESPEPSKEPTEKDDEYEEDYEEDFEKEKETPGMNTPAPIDATLNDRSSE